MSSSLYMSRDLGRESLAQKLVFFRFWVQGLQKSETNPTPLVKIFGQNFPQTVSKVTVLLERLDCETLAKKLFLSRFSQLSLGFPEERGKFERE